MYAKRISPAFISGKDEDEESGSYSFSVSLVERLNPWANRVFGDPDGTVLRNKHVLLHRKLVFKSIRLIIAHSTVSTSCIASLNQAQPAMK